MYFYIYNNFYIYSVYQIVCVCVCCMYWFSFSFLFVSCSGTLLPDGKTVHNRSPAIAPWRPEFKTCIARRTPRGHLSRLLCVYSSARFLLNVFSFLAVCCLFVFYCEKEILEVLLVALLCLLPVSSWLFVYELFVFFLFLFVFCLPTPCCYSFSFFRCFFIVAALVCSLIMQFL